LLAAELAAKAAPDGYTLFMNTTSVWAILPNVKKSLPYDAEKSFVPVSLIASASNVLVVNTAVPATSIAELVKLIKASPGKFNYASAGIASPAHLAGEMFNLLADVKLTHIPYKGAGPALLDVIAGTAQIMITSPGGGTSLIKTGGGTLAFINAFEYDGVFSGSDSHGIHQRLGTRIDRMEAMAIAGNDLAVLGDEAREHGLHRACEIRFAARLVSNLLEQHHALLTGAAVHVAQHTYCGGHRAV